jgi:hypothetical protein
MSYRLTRKKLAEQRKQRYQPPSAKNSSKKLSGLGKSTTVVALSSVLLGSTLFVGYQQPAHAFSMGDLIAPLTDYLQKFVSGFGTGYTDAIAIATKQIQVVGLGINDMANRNATTLAATQQTIDQSLAVKTLITDTGIKGALPDSAACKQTAERTATNTQLKLNQFVSDSISRASAAMPKLNTVDQQSAPLAFHFEFACSPTESAQGLCNMGINGDQFMDVDYALFANKQVMSADKYSVAQNYLNFMNNVGLPESIVQCNGQESCVNEQVNSSVRATAGSLSNYVLSNQMQSRIIYNSDYKPNVE